MGCKALTYHNFSFLEVVSSKKRYREKKIRCKYDQDGNLTSDANKNITSILYNHLNLPRVIKFNNSNAKKINYFYDALGIKLRKVVKDGSTVTTTDYMANGSVYENDELQFMPHPEGYVTPSGNGFRYVYNFKDHLGNIRLSYSDNNRDGNIVASSDPNTNEIIEENSYYPFGLLHKRKNNVITSTNPAQDFKYNGVELEESLGLNLYEMDFRQYDPAIGRFTSIDPVIHYYQSTYTAFDNNPVFWADPSGAYSTAEWMKDNGITDDDLVTVYQAPSDNNSGDSADDDITVNSKGVITKVVENDTPNRYFDESGKELFFNDPALDGQYTEGSWKKGDRLFHPISIKEMFDKILSTNIIFERYTPSFMGSQEMRFLSWFKAIGKGHGDWDFSENWLSTFPDAGLKVNDKNRRNSDSTFDDGVFFRFGNTNNIYNLYDGGNYMWGAAMRVSGFKLWELRVGSNVNEMRKGSMDSKADQRAIKNGFNGN